MTGIKICGRRMQLWVGSAALAFACGLLLLVAGSAGAYTTYSVDGTTGNCANCHGDFRGPNYTSPVDGAWGDDLHTPHASVMLGGECDACHSGTSRSPVFLGSSSGGAGLDAIACAGCHGRAEDGTGAGTVGYSAGLRQHHWRAGITSCVGCHSDSNPANYTPVGEDYLPPYYAAAGYPDIPTDPCNPADTYPEDYAATTLGLDNDGDDLYDEADNVPPTYECPEPGETLMLGVGIGVLLLAGRWRTRR